MKRLAAATRKQDTEGIVDELNRFSYLHDMEHSFDGNLLCFYPAGIACQTNGITHYTARFTTKPKGERFHNLIK